MRSALTKAESLVGQNLSQIGAEIRWLNQRQCALLLVSENSQNTWTPEEKSSLVFLFQIRNLEINFSVIFFFPLGQI